MYTTLSIHSMNHCENGGYNKSDVNNNSNTTVERIPCWNVRVQHFAITDLVLLVLDEACKN